MKKSIQPTYFNQVEISCACGAKLVSGSVVPGPLFVEICSNCHPFYTGEKKLIDTEGRVEKFERMTTQAEAYQATNPKKKKGQKEEVKPRKSLREMLQAVQQ